MALGDRESVNWRGFRGIDPRRSALYPEVLVPQELVEQGLVLDGRNLRFSNGRAYWHRNQLKVKLPTKVCGTIDQLDLAAAISKTISTAVRTSGVVVLTLTAAPGMIVGDMVVVAGVTDAGFNGSFVATAVDTDAKTVTYTHAGGDASSGGGTAQTGGAVCTSNVVRFRTSGAHSLAVNNRVTTSGVTEPDANAVWTVASVPTARHFTATLSHGDFVSGGGLLTPTWPTAVVEYYSSDQNQLLCFADDGTMQFLDTDWSDVPTQWDYGYQLFNDGEWSKTDSPSYEATGLPTAPRWGFANMREKLFVASGESAGFSQGIATKVWDGATLTDVGLATPLTAMTATGHTAAPVAPPDGPSATNQLSAGTYSYYGTLRTPDFESMPCPIVNVTLEDVAATGYIQTTDDETTIDNGDAISIGDITYTFKTVAVDPFDIEIMTGLSSPYYDCYYTLLRLTYRIRGTTGSGLDTIGNPHPDVTASNPQLVSGTWRITLTAREAGEDGNTTVAEVADPNGNFTVASLTGGITYRHVDLTNLPTRTDGQSLRLYRGYTEDVTPGAQASELLYLATINLYSVSTFEDNIAQEALGEPIAFDHALPPRGDILTFHRDRLWMAGVCRTSESYKSVATIAASPGGATWSGGKATITTTTDHHLNIGDEVVTNDVTDAGYNGRFIVTDVPTTTTFKYVVADPGGASGGGTATGGIYTLNLQNRVFYSYLGEPYYWPVENQVTVGDSAPIVALVTWHDQLLILKTNSAFLLTGYFEDDFRLVEIPGVTGAIGPHVATSPYGVVYAGHQGWMLWDGQQAKCLIEYTEDTGFTYDPVSFAPPRVPAGAEANYPAVCYHAGRFHFWAGGYTYLWKPDGDTWEAARRQTSQIGYRAYEFSIYQSHVLAFMRWGDFDDGGYYLTVLDDQHKPTNDEVTTSRFGDTVGSSADDDTYGEVRIELPPVVAPPGEKVYPQEFWLDGQWTVDGSASNRPSLYIFNEGTLTWALIGRLSPGKRLGIPSSVTVDVNGTPTVFNVPQRRVRLLIYALKAPFFAAQACGLVFQRRAAGGN